MAPIHWFISSSALCIIVTLIEIANCNNKYLPPFELHGFKPNETICIMTRDNVCLSTDVYYPLNGEPKPWLTMYTATPYGKGTINPEGWIKSDDGIGYVYLAQDFRGKGGSNGSYSFWRTGGNDTLDTVEWMLKQDWSNGYMTVFGESALGLDQYCDITGVTQAIYNGEGTNGFNKYNELLNRIVFGWLMISDGLGRNTVYQNGAYRECLLDGWLAVIEEPLYIQTVRKHEEFSSYWYPLDGNWTQWDPNGPYNNEPQWDIANLTFIHHAGWYDIFGNNQIETALGANKTSQVNAKGNQILIVEPGGHCEEGGEIYWDHRGYGNTVANNYSHIIAKAALKAKQEGKLFNVHEHIPFNVLFYMLGPGLASVSSKGNFWVQGDGFPASTPKYLYLNSGGRLTDGKPSKSMQESFIYNPKNPVPSHGGSNLLCQPCGPWNQYYIEANRTDILHFHSEPLLDDIYLVGKIVVELYVSSDCVDTDFTAKLLDIYPDEVDNKTVHMLVQDGIQRMRWRKGEYETSPTWMTPGSVYQVEIDVGYMSYIFNRGHRISLSVSSSNNPRFSVNYNSGKMVIDGDTDWKVANNTVYYGDTHGARIILPTVDKKWIEDRKLHL